MVIFFVDCLKVKVTNAQMSYLTWKIVFAFKILFYILKCEIILLMSKYWWTSIIKNETKAQSQNWFYCLRFILCVN